MAQLNEMIISELRGIPNLSEEKKSFLRWILEFERDNIEKDHIIFKPEIEKKLNELLAPLSTKNE